MSKRCKKCKVNYENIEENFNKDKSRKDGFHPYCKTCRKQINKTNYYFKNPKEENYCIDCGSNISELHHQRIRCDGCIIIKEKKRKKEYALKNKDNLEYIRRKRALSKIWRENNPDKYKANMKRNNDKRKRKND